MEKLCNASGFWIVGRIWFCLRCQDILEMNVLSPACYQCPISRTQNICRKWSISLFVKVAASSFKAEIDDAVAVGRSVSQSISTRLLFANSLSLSFSLSLSRRRWPRSASSLALKGLIELKGFSTRDIHNIFVFYLPPLLCAKFVQTTSCMEDPLAWGALPQLLCTFLLTPHWEGHSDSFE